MSKKICSAGVVGPYSYLIIDTDHGDVVGSIKEQQSETVKTFTDMNAAEASIINELQRKTGLQYEVE